MIQMFLTELDRLAARLKLVVRGRAARLRHSETP